MSGPGARRSEPWSAEAEPRHARSPALARIAPFAVFIGLLAAQPWLAAPGIDARWLTISRAAAAAALLAFFRREYRELHGARLLPAREWLLAIATGVAVFLAWITFDHGWAVVGAPGGGFAAPAGGFVPLDADGRIDWTLAILRFAALAAVVPVMEELFWRSFLLRWIDARDFLAFDPAQASLRAFALSSALFASEHSLWFAGLLAGVAYNWLYLRNGNLWAPIIAHGVTNGTLGLWIIATHQWQLW
jgi:CAAX protease family protein